MTTSLLSTAINAAISAGHEILKIYNNPAADFSIEKKADNSPLTVADKAAHQVIMQHLEKTALPVLSEEGKSIPYEIRKNWKTFWMVDPLDGTKEFIKRNGEFTVNIALIENLPCETPEGTVSQGRPVAGIIYVPVTKILYAGAVKEGAWKTTNIGGESTFGEIKTKGTKLPSGTLPQTYTMVGSRSHMNAETENYIAQRKKEHPEIDIVSKGSSLKICLVAEGSAHEYPRFGPTMEWDTAAGNAIANAAGKKLWLIDFSGELQYNKENLLNPYFIVKD